MIQVPISLVEFPRFRVSHKATVGFPNGTAALEVPEPKHVTFAHILAVLMPSHPVMDSLGILEQEIQGNMGPSIIPKDLTKITSYRVEPRISAQEGQTIWFGSLWGDITSIGRLPIPFSKKRSTLSYATFSRLFFCDHSLDHSEGLGPLMER